MMDTLRNAEELLKIILTIILVNCCHYVDPLFVKLYNVRKGSLTPFGYLNFILFHIIGEFH